MVRTACIGHCGGTCLLRVHVKDGVITKIETDDGEEPQFRACLKGRANRQRVYAPDRLKYPLKRTGERGEGTFERISWDEALNTIAAELIRVKEVYGPSAVLFMASGGDTGWLHGGSLIEKLLVRAIGGYSTTWGWYSHGGGKYAALATYGSLQVNNTRDDLLNSRLIIMWGLNPAATILNTNTAWYLAQAKEAGIRIVSVDPRYTASTATFAEQWIPIRPGTDTAMLIAMAYVIISENLQDQKFLDTYTVGFNQFRDYVLGKEDGVPKTPAWAEEITGVSSTAISSLAREYAVTKPAALLPGIAPGRTAYGEQYHRTVMTLAAMTGSIGIHGGNAGEIVWQGSQSSGWTIFDSIRLGPGIAQLMKGSANPVDSAPRRKNGLLASEKFWKGWTSTARVNKFHAADAILKGRSAHYPADYKLLYLVNINYVNQCPNTNKIVEALKKLEFIVAHEQFMTATARFADIILPVNSFLERNDLTLGGATPMYGYVNKVIDPLYESKSHFDIAVELAAKLGIPDYSDKTEEEWLKEVVEGCKDIPDYATFKTNGIHKVRLKEPAVAFEKEIRDPANNPFPTPSGKIEIYSEELAHCNDPLLPPIPKYIETWESCNDALAKKYPLQLITTHFKRRIHSQFDNIPWLMELESQAVWINSVDAKARDIEDGDEVYVFNDRGKMIIRAKVTEAIMPGVVDIPQGAWYNPDSQQVDRGGCANILTKDAVSPGEAFPCNTALVQVEKGARNI